RDRAVLEDKTATVAASLDEETAALARHTEDLDAHRKLIDERQQAFRDGQLALNNLNREIEQHKSAILDLMRRLAQANSAINSIEIERKNIAGQQSRTAERRRVVVEEIQKLEAQRGELQQKLDAVQAHIAEQQAQLDARRDD